MPWIGNSVETENISGYLVLEKLEEDGVGLLNVYRLSFGDDDSVLK